MKAIDTNILIRFLTVDDPKQFQLVSQLFEIAERTNQKLLVTPLVVLEMVWVLKTSFKTTRKNIILALDNILGLEFLFFQSRNTLEQLVQLAPKYPSLDISDLLIALLAKNSGATSIISFDKKAQKYSFFEELT